MVLKPWFERRGIEYTPKRQQFWQYYGFQNCKICCIQTLHGTQNHSIFSKPLNILCIQTLCFHVQTVKTQQVMIFFLSVPLERMNSTKIV